MAGGSALPPEEARIWVEELITPLKELRLTSGGPSDEVLAERTGLSRNTINNVFNARTRPLGKTIEAIAQALGGNTPEWQARWAAARSRIAALQVTAETPEAERRTPLARRRILFVAAAAAAVALIGLVISLGDDGREREISEPKVASTGLPSLSPTAVASQPVSGNPVFQQCSGRDRSILSEPGRVRGGKPRGRLRPGERFVVTARTSYWRYGQAASDPQRRGWVMAEYLCR